MLDQLGFVVSYYLDDLVYNDDGDIITELHNRKRNGKHVDMSYKYHGTQVFNYKDGQRHGLFQRFQSNILVEKYNYINDIPEGPFVVSNGDSYKREGTYINGYHHGEIRTYINGKLKEVGTYVRSNLTGPKITYYDNGSVKSEANYEKDILHGLENQYDQSGRLCVSTYYDYEQKHGEEIQYYSDGSIKSKIEYCYDKMHGSCIEYYKDGTLKHTCTFIHGFESGPEAFYRRDGSLDEYRIMDKEEVIKSIKFHKNGIVKCVTHYDYAIFYNKDGSIKCEGEMYRGERVRVWLFYNGEDVREKTYESQGF